MRRAKDDKEEGEKKVAEPGFMTLKSARILHKMKEKCRRQT